MNGNMTPVDWAKRPLQKYMDFSGRAPRAEYWWFVLFVIIGEVIAMIVDSIIGTGQMFGPYGLVLCLFLLAVIVPSLAVGVRRLHDTDRPGWWLLIGLIPIIGAIVLLVFFVTEGTKGDNQYGPDPYAGQA
jgi:uncharacterized membrane protein YhaH (DUF805 family)